MPKISKAELVVGLHDNGNLGFYRPGEDWVRLKSGRRAPFYYNQRSIASFENKDGQKKAKEASMLRRGVVGAYSEMLRNHKYETGVEPDHIYGLPESVTSITGMVGYATGLSVLWGRASTKDYGKHKAVEGEYHTGDTVIALDDVITTADTKIEQGLKLRAHGLDVLKFAVMFDREEGGMEALSSAGYRAVAYVGLAESVAILREEKRLDSGHIDALNQYRTELGLGELQ